jgi:hypothetical protein
VKFRETQADHFGKRGMSWHGAAVFVNSASHNALFGGAKAVGSIQQPYQVYYFHDILVDNDVQSTATVIGVIDTLLGRIKALFPDTVSVSLQSVCELICVMVLVILFSFHLFSGQWSVLCWMLVSTDAAVLVQPLWPSDYILCTE